MVPLTCSWATGATSSGSYSASCQTGSSQHSCEVIGAPDVAPSCGDLGGAWSPQTSSGTHWLQAWYPQLFLVHRITIYETNRAPFVNSVEAINSATNSPTTVWQGTDTTTCGSSLDVVIPNGVLADRVKVNTATTSYPQIDAVQICGLVVPSPPAFPPSPPAPPAVPPPCSGQIDLVMVLDNSASVGAQRPDVLTFARQVVSFFTMGATAAQIGYVEFHDTVQTFSALTPSLSTISTALDNAPGVGSGTFLSGGIDQGQAVLTGTGARTGVPKVLILMSDGVQTVGGNDNTAISAATTAKNAGTKIIAVGFGGVSLTTLNAIATSPSSTHALYQTTARNIVDLIANGEYDICVTAADQPRGPPPSPPSPPSLPPPPSLSPPPSTPPPLPNTPPIDCAYCSDLYTAFATSQATITAAGACPSGSIADTDGTGRNICKMWVDGRMWFVPRE